MPRITSTHHQLLFHVTKQPMTTPELASKTHLPLLDVERVMHELYADLRVQHYRESGVRYWRNIACLTRH